MSTNTNNLGLFKWDKNNATDKASQFDIDRALNQNWDKIDAEAEKKNNEIKELKSQLPTNTATGEVINITDATDIPIKDFKIDGKSEQVTNILPTGYTQVDYIESTGTQYIDTGIVNSANIRIVDCVSSEGSDAFSGATLSNDWTNNSRFKWGSNGNVYYGYASNSPSIGNASLDTYYIYDLANGSQKINDIEKTTYTLSVFSQYTITLFCLRQGENVNLSSSSQRRKYTKIYDNNNIVRHFIPCYRNSDNVVGMYDLINNVFYTNQGTGTFNYGGILPNPNAPVDIETITGDIKIIGKNLITFKADKLALGARYNANNWNNPETWGGAWRTNYKILVKPNTRYTFSFNIYPNMYLGRVYFAFGDKNDEFISAIIPYYDKSVEQNNLNNTYSFTTPANAFYMIVSGSNCGTRINSTNTDFDYTRMEELFENLQLEEGNTKTSYKSYTEVTIPLGTTELAKVGSVSDKSIIDTETRVVSKIRNIEKIDSYNGETITTDYISSTGELSTGATVYYVSANPTTETITTLTQEQLEILKPNVGENTYQMITNLGRTNINIEYYQNIGILINNLTALVSST